MITALTLYPIKGCQGIALQQAYAMHEGLAIRLANGQMLHDRQFMVVDSQGVFITQREVAQMATIAVQVTDDGFTVTAPGHPPLEISLNDEARRVRPTTVWDFSGSGLDVGPKAMGWFTKVLQRPAALVEFNKNTPRLCKALGAAAAHTFYADSFAYLIISEASINDLEQRLKEHHQDANLSLPANRFRANIIIDEIEAYEEDFLTSAHTEAVTLEIVSKCVRCNVPSIDQNSGTVQSESPTELLDTYRLDQARGGSTIGVNAILLPQTPHASISQASDSPSPAVIKVGQPLALKYSF
jgi:uncharacterized protein